jgi:cytosine/adenosine deaminase-related metal-dependent hydrolase
MITAITLFRKFKADNLFTGTEMLGSNKVLLTTPDGEIDAIINEEQAGEDIEYYKGIISPGFINAHCHLELSHLKGKIQEKIGLVDFVYSVVNTRHSAEEQILDAIEKAENEMLLNGIVAVGDICNNVLSLPQKLKKKLAYHNFIEASGWEPTVSQQRFERSLQILNYYSNKLEDVNHQSLIPHAPYSVSNELWRLIIPYFRNKIVSIHNQETLFEDEFFQQGTGDFVRMYEMMKLDNSHHQPTKKSSLQTSYNNLISAEKIILVHNTFTKQSDIDFIKEEKENFEKTYFCLCINANKYIEDRLPPVELFLKNACNMVLGTDSLASNWSLNLLDEMKTLQKIFPDITLEVMLQWATINGANVLEMDKKLGSFEKGKKPGVVVLQKVEGLQLSPDSSIKRII